jgi:hypothetical protein
MKCKNRIPEGPARGSKSGKWPLSYQSLTDSETKQVRAAFLYYNAIHPDEPYFEVEEFYQQKFRLGGWSA